MPLTYPLSFCASHFFAAPTAPSCCQQPISIRSPTMAQHGLALLLPPILTGQAEASSHPMFHLPHQPQTLTLSSLQPPFLLSFVVSTYSDDYVPIVTVFFGNSPRTLLMEGIPNNHLGCGINPVNNGDKLPFPQLMFAGFLVAINSSKWTVPKKIRQKSVEGKVVYKWTVPKEVGCLPSYINRSS